MAMTDQTRVNSLLNWILSSGAIPAQPTALHMRLGTTAPANTTNMTELTGTGYTAGGTAVTWNAASAGKVTGPVTATSWTNSSGSAWSIVGIEIWDTAATPLRWFFGSWTGQPISVANGNSFNVASAAVSVDASAW